MTELQLNQEQELFLAKQQAHRDWVNLSKETDDLFDVWNKLSDENTKAFSEYRIKQELAHKASDGFIAASDAWARAFKENTKSLYPVT